MRNMEKQAIENTESYQGWSNYESWAVRLHWDNNEGDYRHMTEEAKNYKKAGKSIREFADYMKETAEEIQDIVIEGQGNEEQKSFMHDVGSLWRVNWYEIAESYYNEVE